MASKIGRFVSQVKDIVQEESRKQTDELLERFKEVIQEESEESEEESEESEEESEESEEESSTATVDDLLALKYDLMMSINVAKKELEQDLAELGEQVVQESDVTPRIETPAPEEETTQTPAPEEETTQTPAPEVSQNTNVSEVVTTEEPVAESSEKVNKKSPWTSVLGAVSKGFSKVIAPLKIINSLFSKSLSDRAAAITLIVMTVITVVAGIISAIKWVYSKITESLDSLWLSISGAFDSLFKWIEEYLIIPLAKGINWIADKFGFEPPFENYVTKYEDEGVPVGTASQQWAVTTEGAPWLNKEVKESTPAPDYKAPWGGIDLPDNEPIKLPYEVAEQETQETPVPSAIPLEQGSEGFQVPFAPGYQPMSYKTDVKSINVYGQRASDYYDQT